MSVVIKSGSDGFTADVTDDNHLEVAARTSSAEFDHTLRGSSWNINPGTFAFTGTTASGLLYVKNTGTNPIVIPAVIWLLGTTDGTFGEWTVKVYANPTTGTLISDANSEVPVNKNFSSTKTMTATVYSASAYGKTVTNGTVAIQSIFPSSGRYVVGVPVVLEQGAACALEVTAPGSTTSANVQVAIAPYERVLGG
jgi:hypothetical protein